MFTKFSLSLLLVAATAGSALASETEIDCSSACPSGKVMTSFADGDDVTCMCVDAAAMDPTVADPEVPTGEDPDNTY